MSVTALDAAVERVTASAYTVPTDAPESDGTLTWDATTIAIVEVVAGDEVGLGYTYGDASVARFVESLLADAVAGRDALDVGSCWTAMQDRIRNAGRPGLGQMAVAAVDVALWDLKAKLLGIPLVRALDAVHEQVPIYGSGGFTSYSLDRLGGQLAGWVADGIPRVKMKVGRDPQLDPHRLAAAREAVGDDVALYVDANGAYTRKEALGWADRYASEWNVSWFEEPVGSDDLEGLRLLRDRGPGGMDVAAGEYGDTLPTFERMLAAGAVDCLQADVTRCGGITGLRGVAALCEARSLDLSAHCAPQISAHAFCAVRNVRHLEYFHDHVRVEELLFDGVVAPEHGVAAPRPLAPRARARAEAGGGGAMGGLIARLAANIRAGRVQKALSLTTAVSASGLGVEIYLEHYRGSFGNRWMWTPLLLTPPLLAAGVAGFRSERAARRWLPLAGSLYAIDGLVGVVTHVQGVRKRPGGFAEPTVNLVMGPPLLAPGSLALVGVLAIAAAVARRER